MGENSLIEENSGNPMNTEENKITMTKSYLIKKEVMNKYNDNNKVSY